MIECEGGAIVFNEKYPDGACFCEPGFTGVACNLTVASVNALQQDLRQLHEAVNTEWILLCAFSVFFMQTGFGMLEAGSVRAKNTLNILMKNVIDSAITSIGFWGFGYGLAYGHRDPSSKSTFAGDDDFFFSSQVDYSLWIVSWSYACICTTIVSGSVAERCSFKAYVIFSIAMSTFIYPISTHWCWSSTGWMSPKNIHRAVGDNGYLDFAGGGVVHIVGGMSGLAGAYLIGARLGKFESKVKLQGHSMTLASLGTLILWFGWYGFNPGALLRITNGGGYIASKAAVSTTLSASAGGITTLLIRKVETNLFQLPTLLNGLLSGLVAITAPGSYVEPWAAVVIGMVSAFIYIGGVHLLEKCKIDDPLDATVVHGFCGAWGVISIGLFGRHDNIAKIIGAERVGSYGLFYGGGVEQLGIQLLGVVCLSAWSFGMSFLVFSILRQAIGLRVSREVELSGLDNAEHGSHAYPEFQLLQSQDSDF